jgi:hypothetical protein
MYGALDVSPAFSLDDATPIEMPSQKFFEASNKRYDWAEAVRTAIGAFNPPDEPERIPIRVWTPNADNGDRVKVNVRFSDQCPIDRFIVITDARTQEVALALFVGGARAGHADVRLSGPGVWNISLQTGEGERLSGAQLELGPQGIEVGGTMRCTNGKGLFDQGSLPLTVPNPSLIPSQQPQPDPSASPSEQAVNALNPIAGVLFIAALAGLTTTAYLLRRRVGS